MMKRFWCWLSSGHLCINEHYMDVSDPDVMRLAIAAPMVLFTPYRWTCDCGLYEEQVFKGRRKVDKA